MSIIAVLEFPEDDGAELYFVDLDKLDMNNPIHVHYKNNIMSALNDSSGIETTSFDASMAYGSENLESASVKPPCMVENSVILYVE